MKRLLFILMIIASPVFGDDTNPDFITRDELVDIIYDEDIDALQSLFAETHSRVASGELPLSYLRGLNTWLIVTDPKVLAVSSTWLENIPDSIYAKVVAAFQARKLAWGVRGNRYPSETYPDAMSGFNALNEQAFRLAYEAYLAAPGYVPASDAVISFNGTMQVFWSGEIESIIADTMDLHPNFGTIIRAAPMHLPQWGGEGISGVKRLCETYIPQVTPQEWLSVETCIAYLIWSNSFDEDARSIAEFVLADLPLPSGGIDFQVMKSIIGSDRVDRKGEVLTYLERVGGMDLRDIELVGSYIRWQRGPESMELQNAVIKRTIETGKDVLRYDPFNPQALDALAHRTPLRTSVLEERDAQDLDLHARLVSANPYDPVRWRRLAALVLRTHGFREAQAFYTNAIAYGLQRTKISSEYILQMVQHLLDLERDVERGQMTNSEMEVVKADMICEANRVRQLNELLCAYDSRFYALECNPFSETAFPIDIVREAGQDFMTMAQNEGAFCNQDPDADFEQTSYFPVEADVAQFINHQRPTARE